MKKFFSLGISLMLFSFITSSLYAATPLVDAVWVKDQICLLYTSDAADDL